jgi:hypothetical protein
MYNLVVDVSRKYTGNGTSISQRLHIAGSVVVVNDECCDLELPTELTVVRLDPII